MDVPMLRRQARELFDRIPVVLQPLLFVVLPVLLLHPLWTSGAADAGAKEQGRKFELTPNRRAQVPVPVDFVRQTVQADSRFTDIKQAMCPRRLPDRYEEIARYPAFRILQNSHWGTVTDDSSRGVYEKVIEITPEGRLEFMNDLTEDADRYIFNIARRSYIEGSEIERPGPNGVSVAFRWKWQPLNKPGAIFDLSPPYRSQDSLNGSAEFKDGPNGWELVDLWLEDDGHNYMTSQ
jgi:hypothetical protein